MNHRKIFYWSITVALAGFLFGFDTVVISGADLSLQELWQRGELFHGFVVMASALWGTVVGALLGGIPTDKWGRKKTLFWIGIFYFVSAVGSALANDPWVFAIFRFIGGLAVGASTIAAPAYISEIAPASNRGRLVALYQFNIVFGILVAFLSNFLLKDFGAEPWRWMIGAEALPAFLYTLMVLTVPESPRWLLVKKQDRKAAAETLRLIDPDVDPAIEMQRIEADHGEADKTETIFSPKYRKPLMLAFFIAFFNQFSGINAFLYYAPRIFQDAGLDESSALLSSVGIGIANLLFTLIGLTLIDKLGRKQLMYIGSVGYIISLSMVAASFGMGWTGMAVPGFLFLFIASHAIGQGAVIWVFIAEIFPNHLRASGQAFGSSVHWWLAALIPALMPVTTKTIGNATVFGFFAAMMVLQLLWVWRKMPETKGVSLEDLEKQLTK
ncbi:MAG: sugar porter family MFS transporter [Saprospiraceae bacterium]|jgi:sugar porter (SP) family MFS transporter|nr:sugar porter family MFS transporter [Saprospiraceae bacterium]